MLLNNKPEDKYFSVIEVEAYPPSKLQNMHINGQKDQLTC